MEGSSLVYSDTSVTSVAGVVSVGHHTSAIYFWNKSTSTDAEVKLNGIYSIIIPQSASGGEGLYIEIIGDYTKFEVITTSVDLAVYAVG